MNVYDEDYVDGIDKMKHFGFNIHNWIDGYSRKIMWMEKVYSSKYLKILLHSYLFTIKKSQFCYLLCKGFSWEFDYRSCLTMGTIFPESRQQTKTLNFFHGYVQDILDGVTTYWNHHKISINHTHQIDDEIFCIFCHTWMISQNKTKLLIQKNRTYISKWER